MGSFPMFQWCPLLCIEHLLEGYWYTGSLFRILPGIWLKILKFMRSLLGHGKVRPSSRFGPIFYPQPLISVHSSFLRSLGNGLPLWDRTKPICHLNLDFKSDSGMYAYALFEVPKNDLKKWVLEFVALLKPEGEVGPTL